MALIQLKDGTSHTVEPHIGAYLWQVKHENKEASEQVQKKVDTIQRIYLNWRHPSTPDSYLQKHEDIINTMGVTL